jgi:hypothetical protein
MPHEAIRSIELLTTIDADVPASCTTLQGALKNCGGYRRFLCRLELFHALHRKYLVFVGMHSVSGHDVRQPRPSQRPNRQSLAFRRASHVAGSIGTCTIL